MKLAIFDLNGWKKKYGSDLIKVQLDKIKEEYLEFVDAIVEKSRAEELEEGIDVLQSTLVLMHMLATPEQIEKAFTRHKEKLEGYEKIGRVPKILGWVETEGMERWI